MDSDDIKFRISEIKDLIKQEERKRIDFKRENTRRKHNYLPFIIETLKILAEKEKLVDLVNKAKSRKQ